MKNKRNIFVVIVLILMIVLGLGYVISHLDKDNSLSTGSFVLSSGKTVDINQDLLLLNLTSECDATTEFFVVAEHLQLERIPEGGCKFAWEIGEEDEIAYVGSSVGNLEYIEDNNYAIIDLPGGRSNLSVVVYIKTYDLDTTLNNIFVSNEKTVIPNGFKYKVILPDDSEEIYNVYEASDEASTLKDYFKKVL